MARIEHVAVWTSSPERLERLRTFYEMHFGAVAGAPTPYRSTRRPGFASYFLTLPDGGPRLELMALPDDARSREELGAGRPVPGWAHVALAFGSRGVVDTCVARLAAAGVTVVAWPRVTGEGYYKAVVRDPDGNEIEIMA